MTARANMVGMRMLREYIEFVLSEATGDDSAFQVVFSPMNSLVVARLETNGRVACVGPITDFESMELTGYEVLVQDRDGNDLLACHVTECEGEQGMNPVVKLVAGALVC